MRSVETIILGGGIIGLTLALELRKRQVGVLILEKREPGLEATHAAAGMLAPQGGDLPPELRLLAESSARMYPEFITEVEDASGMNTDFRTQGTVLFPDAAEAHTLAGAKPLNSAELLQLEPALAAREGAFFLEEQSVDPRALAAACLAAARKHGAHLATGEEALEVSAVGNGVEVRTARTRYSARQVVNCCGAWSGQVRPLALPTRPVKGQMLSVIPKKRGLLEHVVRAPEVYLVPRTDGRILIGATVEEAGFDKRVNPVVIQALHHAAAELVPALAEAKMHEAWAGLRPSTADDLPILGATELPGYFMATGHFRNGILLAPITARLMTQVLLGEAPACDLGTFSVSRFLKARSRILAS